MGVSGCGKSTVGSLLAKELAVPFYDADDFHPAVNIAKMKAGTPLTDKDRQPWLLSLHSLLANHKQEGAVLACSALKESYRKTLAGDIEVNWVYLQGEFALIQARMQERAHFMPASLLESQFDTLEPLKSGLTLDISDSPELLVQKIRARYETENTAQLGIVGMGVMGRSLAKNAVSKGIDTAVYNRASEGEEHIIPQLLSDYPSPQLSGFTDWEGFMGKLRSPKVILLMVPAGNIVDQIIAQMEPYLSPGDCIIDGGNTHYEDTECRCSALQQKNIGYLGMGVSGGEEGALKGPALMPGGNRASFDLAALLLQQLAAKDPKGEACVGYLGDGGCGHLVKTVHNGIEYAEMQLLAELYSFISISNVPRAEYGNTFAGFNKGLYSSYLLSIMPPILNKKEDEAFLVDMILDEAAHKGTGAWTAQTALKYGQDASIIIAALNARYHSTAGWFRQLAQGPSGKQDKIEINLQRLLKAYQAARVLNHLQGLRLIKEVSQAMDWKVNLAEVTRIWTNGCIIKSTLMEELHELLLEDSVSLEQWAISAFNQAKEDLKYALDLGITNDLHLPVFSAALQFGLGINTTTTTANIIQAQRDYFGAHTYKRKDADASENFHTDWNKS